MTDALVDRIVDGITADALSGLGEWALYAESRAKHYAPVRRVFYGSRNSETEFPRGQSFRGRPILIRTQAAMDLYKASRRRMKRISWLGESRLGEANSYNPIFSRGKGRRITGLTESFRKVERDKQGQPHLARIEAVETRPGRGHREFLGRRLENKREAAYYPDQRFSARSELNYRGRYELSSKAKGRAIYQDSKGRETLGGRLRGEISISPTVRQGSVYWIYVVSPTPYGFFQEFGTRHNRAHPYLRPALYDASRRTSIVRGAIRLGRRI